MTSTSSSEVISLFKNRCRKDDSLLYKRRGHILCHKQCECSYSTLSIVFSWMQIRHAVHFWYAKSHIISIYLEEHKTLDMLLKKNSTITRYPLGAALKMKQVRSLTRLVPLDHQVLQDLKLIESLDIAELKGNEVG